MSNFTAADVKKLRDLTGSGMMDCKKALEEAEGDFDKGGRDPARQGRQGCRQAGRSDRGQRPCRALRQRTAGAQLRDRLRGQEPRLHRVGPDMVSYVDKARPDDAEALLAGQARGRPDRGRDGRGGLPPDRREAGGQPVRGARRRPGHLHAPQEPGPAAAGWGRGVQFTGKSDEAGESDARGIAMQIAAMRPKYVSRDEVPADVVAPRAPHRRRDRPRGGQAEAALPKIVEGRVKRFYKDVVLVDQASVSDNKKTVKQVLAEAALKWTRFVRFRGRPGLTSYPRPVIHSECRREGVARVCTPRRGDPFRMGRSHTRLLRGCHMGRPMPRRGVEWTS